MIRHSSGKGSRATTGGGLPLPFLPASTITPPSLKLAMPMPDRLPRASSIASPSTSSGRLMQRAQRRGDGERDLGAGTETGMARNRLFDDQPVLGANAETLAQRRQMRGRALAFRPFDDGLARPRQRHHGLGLAERKAEAAEAAPGVCRRDRESRDGVGRALLW